MTKDEAVNLALDCGAFRYPEGTMYEMTADNLAKFAEMVLAADRAKNIVESKLVNCYAVPRSLDGPLFAQKPNKEVTANLDGYAVIPVEAFEAMGGEENEGFRLWSQENRHPQT